MRSAVLVLSLLSSCWWYGVSGMWQYLEHIFPSVVCIFLHVASRQSDLVDSWRS